MTTKHRESRLALRRQDKFDQHRIQIKEENAEEERKRKVRRFNPNTGTEQEETERFLVKFSHAVYAGAALVGRTHSRRSAMKRAHQECKNRANR